MEYAVPRKSLAHVLDEIDGWLQRSGEQIGFPVEVRLAAADNIPLSTAFGRETCYIAVHQYHRRPHEKYFPAVEAIAREVDGRPHWGKLHYRTAEDLAPAYPLFDEFLAVRDQLRPGPPVRQRLPAPGAGQLRVAVASTRYRQLTGAQTGPRPTAGARSALPVSSLTATCTWLRPRSLAR